jgi:hypothetical protein
VVGTDLVIGKNTGQGRVIQELVEYVLGVQGGLLTPDRHHQAGKQYE